MTALVEPPYAADERTTLVAFVDYFRAVLIRKAEGLTDEQARITVGASELTILGLVRHMVVVERAWFQETFAGRDVEFEWLTDEDPDGDFHPGPDDTLADALAAYRAEIAATDAVIAVAELDLVVARPDHGRAVTMRWILVHMVEELARHCGHADLIREAVDGTVGD